MPPRPRKPGNPATGRSKNAGEAAEKQAKIVALRAQGVAWTAICNEVGVSIGWAKEVWKKFVAEGKLTIQQTDPVAVIFEQISRLDADINTCAEIARSEKTDNDSARIGAIKAKAMLMEQQIKLLQAVGLVPKNLGKISVEIEQRYVIQQLLVFVNEFVPPDRLEAAEERLIELFRKPKPEELLEPAA